MTDFERRFYSWIIVIEGAKNHHQTSSAICIYQTILELSKYSGIYKVSLPFGIRVLFSKSIGAPEKQL